MDNYWVRIAKRHDLLEKLYGIPKSDRVAFLPTLSPMEIEQLKQLFYPRWDGHVNSKMLRDLLNEKGMIDRWNGWNFISQLGICFLDAMGELDEDWERKVHRNCVAKPLSSE